MFTRITLETLSKPQLQRFKLFFLKLFPPSKFEPLQMNKLAKQLGVILIWINLLNVDPFLIKNEMMPDMNKFSFHDAKSLAYCFSTLWCSLTYFKEPYIRSYFVSFLSTYMLTETMSTYNIVSDLTIISPKHQL